MRQRRREPRAAHLRRPRQRACGRHVASDPTCGASEIGGPRRPEGPCDAQAPPAYAKQAPRGATWTRTAGEARQPRRPRPVVVDRAQPRQPHARCATRDVVRIVARPLPSSTRATHCRHAGPLPCDGRTPRPRCGARRARSPPAFASTRKRGGRAAWTAWRESRRPVPQLRHGDRRPSHCAASCAALGLAAEWQPTRRARSCTGKSLPLDSMLAKFEQVRPLYLPPPCACARARPGASTRGPCAAPRRNSFVFSIVLAAPLPPLPPPPPSPPSARTCAASGF